MKIALFTEAYHPYISGVITSIDIIRYGLEEKGHEVYIITLNTNFDNVDIDDHVIKFKGKKYPLKALKDYSYTNGLKNKVKYLSKYKFDVVHANSEFSAGRMAVLYSKIYNVPLVYTFHTNYEDYLSYITDKMKFITHYLLTLEIKRIVKFYQKYASVVIVPTTKVIDTFEKYKSNLDVTVLPTGIDLSKFNEKNLEESKLEYLKQKYNLNNKFVFCSIGRISKEKNIDIVINCFAKANIDDSLLLICGTGPFEEVLHSLVDKLKIKDKVIFTGSIPYEEINYYYGISDVFLNASTSETQGLTYIEAIASSTVLLVKKDKALDGVLIEGENGLYFNNDEELISKMQFLKEENNTFEYMKNKCYNTVEQYSKEVFINSIEEIYKKIIYKV